MLYFSGGKQGIAVSRYQLLMRLLQCWESDLYRTLIIGRKLPVKLKLAIQPILSLLLSFFWSLFNNYVICIIVETITNYHSIQIVSTMAVSALETGLLYSAFIFSTSLFSTTTAVVLTYSSFFAINSFLSSSESMA